MFSLPCYTRLTMSYVVKITSKRQISIPAKVFNQVRLKEGDKLVVNVKSNKIILEKLQESLDQLAGSIEIPQKYKNKSLNDIISEAKKDYFSEQK